VYFSCVTCSHRVHGSPQIPTRVIPESQRPVLLGVALSCRSVGESLRRALLRKTVMHAVRHTVLLLSLDVTWAWNLLCRTTCTFWLSKPGVDMKCAAGFVFWHLLPPGAPAATGAAGLGTVLHVIRGAAGGPRLWDLRLGEQGHALSCDDAVRL
jgi:hypothetical protein